MGFALTLVVLGIFGRYLDTNSTYHPTSQDLSILTDVFSKQRSTFAQDRKAEQFKQGILSNSKNAVFEVSLGAGECKTFLAMLLPNSSLSVKHEVTGEGKDRAKIKTSSGINFHTGELCAGNKPVKVALTLTATDNASPYIVETYFSSRQIFGSDVSETRTAIVHVSQLTLVRPKNYDTNNKYFVHVFSDEVNRGSAARALAILLENGFKTRPHIEQDSNMAGWKQQGNGILAGSGEGTQGKAVEVRRLLKPILSNERLEIYTNGENPDLTSMDGKTLALFLSGE